MLLILKLLPLCFLVLGAIGYGIGGLACWIQDLNFLVAAIPLAMGLAGIIDFKKTRDPTSRLRGVMFVGTFMAFFVYGFMRVKEHKDMIVANRAALEPVITALHAFKEEHGTFPSTLTEVDATVPSGLIVDYKLDASSGFLLAFHHNLFRRQVRDARDDHWRDRG